VDGADPATDWQGPHALDELPRVINPKSGWIFNTNDAPWAAAGPDSPRAADYPLYMDTAGENPRGLHATRLLTGRKDFTLESLIRAAYDSYLPAFAELIPALAKACDATPAADPLKARLADQVALLKAWDDRWSASSTETSLAVFWGEALRAKVGADVTGNSEAAIQAMIARTTPAQKLEALAEASDRLARDFGSWRTPWGEINRYQRTTGDIVQTFSDAKPSMAVPFTSSQWGSLASFGARRYPGTRRDYGTSGNSFVAAVEFGDKVRAFAVSAGGESGDPASPHFADQAVRYAAGDLREVYFYPEQLVGHIERRYHPGE
jgi:acyl-homoserine-lactone acylase